MGQSLFVSSAFLGQVFRATVGSTTFQSTIGTLGTDYNGFQGYAVASGHILKRTSEGTHEYEATVLQQMATDMTYVWP